MTKATTTPKSKKKRPPKVMPTVDNPATLQGSDIPIGVAPGAVLPTSFRINGQIKASLELQRRGPRSRGFHPSEMARLCVMKYSIYEQSIEGFASADPQVIQQSTKTFRAILDTVHDVKPGRLPARLLPDFDGGDSIHRYQQFRYGERGILWGKWRCPNCDAISEEGFMPRMTVIGSDDAPTHVAAFCTACSGGNYRSRYRQVKWIYEEPWMGDPLWEIDGHADGILLKPYRNVIVPAIFEIKSINEAGYHGSYGEPLPRTDHIKQASQYVALARATYPWLRDMRHIYFCYVNKNAQRETKEFLVEADESVIAEVQHTMTVALTVKRQGMPADKQPLRKCSSIEAVDAIKCPVAEQCFGMKRPANFFDPNFNMEELPL